MRAMRPVALLCAAVAALCLLPACHAVPMCVGSCDAGGEPAEEPDGDAAQEWEALPDRPEWEVPEIPEAVGEDGPDAPDYPDGCVPCEFLLPDCVEGHTCCSDASGKETCNLMDDDCDGRVDEDINLQTDPRNCGSCGNRCSLPHAEMACETGGCVFVRCLTYYHDCAVDDPGDPESLGCETYCASSSDDDTVCDHIDNDCDCRVDEDIDFTTDIGNCGACGVRCRFPHAVSGCESPDGTAASAACVIDRCDDGYVDSVEVEGPDCEYECTPCQETEGACTSGATCCTTGGDETCNSVDDDCDGDTDEGNPGGGVLCGSDAGECAAGTETCVDGRIECAGGTGPAGETCNGKDDDCDGSIDEPDEGQVTLPDENLPCGDSTGDCEFGRTVCRGVAIACEGGVGPGVEECDGHDNDCDGSVDESPIAGEGDQCGSDIGLCVHGSKVCRSGGWVCNGETGPSPELCDTFDNDCNGAADDPWNFDSDPDNCGSCGHRCAPEFGPHDLFVCASRRCVLVGCAPNWWDIDPPAGCEYNCTYSGGEICDGRDNDCDKLVDGADPSMGGVANFCPQFGECRGSSPQCATYGGVTRWYCNYGSTVNYDPADHTTLLPETNCDDKDNDCDGDTDEAYPLKGTECSDGRGLCKRTGAWRCKEPAHDGIECSAHAAPPQAEVCNGVDDNCNDIVDDFAADAWGVIGAVPASTGLVDYVFQYEASRPNAAACAGGTQDGTGSTLTTKACSRIGVQPWTNADWTTALEACCNLNSDGQCHYSGSNPTGWNLCRASEWEDLCEGSGRDWVYPYHAATYSGGSCNGNDYDTNCPCPGTCTTPGDQDEILAAGALGTCCSTWGASCVYDMSGNVKEWTATPRGSGYREIRGGASNNPAAGLTCQFSFTLAAESFSFFNLGFRCCHYR